MKVLGALDRFVLTQWIGTFLLAAIGIPAVSTLIHLAERFGPLSKRNVSTADILLGELLYVPGQMTLLLPAAVLFATVFTLNAMGRHSELTAVKASGVSFYRLIAPMMVMAMIAVPANFALQEVSAASTAEQRVLHKERRTGRDATPRYQFAYQTADGWTYAFRELEPRGYAASVLLESPGDGRTTWTVSADSARWMPTRTQWQLFNGASHMLVKPERVDSLSVADSASATQDLLAAGKTPPNIAAQKRVAARQGQDTSVADRDAAAVTTFRFARMRSAVFREAPSVLADDGKKAEEMSIGELRAHLDRLQRSGSRPGQLLVDLPLKYAVPLACLIIALFGAPLAVTSPRAGAALGLAMALGTTLIYLTGTQIMKALGGKEIIAPELAAWSMNGVFLLLAVVLMSRVRS